MQYKRPKLILFAKTPLTGKVKTRLCPPLSKHQAAQVAIILIEKSIEKVSLYWPGMIELCVWPQIQNQILLNFKNDYDIHLSTQSDGDLGKKMYSAIKQNHISGHKVLIMGCDVPHCDEHNLMSAYKALENNQNVIGPTHDGGYYCIGVNQFHEKMFDNVQWGSDKAYAQTVKSCNHQNINFDIILPKLTDLDTFADLKKVAKQIPDLKCFTAL